MATPTDKLPPPQPNRVYYSLGRMLGVEDFQADQDYHRGRLARALLQVCGTGTVQGLLVTVSQLWQPATQYNKFAMVYDSAQNVQVNTGAAGLSGDTQPAFAASPGGAVQDATTNPIVWTNEGPLDAIGWRPNTPFTAPKAIIDSNGNVQILSAASPFTTGSGLKQPNWAATLGATALDGSPSVPAWTCCGPAEMEVEVTPGMAVDRAGRMIESANTVCIRLQQWLNGQTDSDMTQAVHAGNLIVDVFATFVPCTRGVTPCFATQDNYDATDAFSPNRLLDSFAMQLVLRTDSNPLTPQVPWLPAGPPPSGPIDAAAVKAMQRAVLGGAAGPGAVPPFAANGKVGAEYMPGFDPSSVFLARLSIPATQPLGAPRPIVSVYQTAIDNFLRLFLYPASLVARAIGITSGKEA